MYDFFGLGQACPSPFQPKDNNADNQGDQADWDACPQDAQGKNNLVLHIEGGLDLNMAPAV
jgi:hypothetical protein